MPWKSLNWDQIQSQILSLSACCKYSPPFVSVPELLYQNPLRIHKSVHGLICVTSDLMSEQDFLRTAETTPSLRRSLGGLRKPPLACLSNPKWLSFSIHSTRSDQRCWGQGYQEQMVLCAVSTPTSFKTMFKELQYAQPFAPPQHPEVIIGAQVHGLACFSQPALTNGSRQPLRSDLQTQTGF